MELEDITRRDFLKRLIRGCIGFGLGYASIHDYEGAYANVKEHSLDNTRIVFSSNRDGNREIYGMGPHGRNIVRLTFDQAYNSFNPALSPDRTKIIFVREGIGDGSLDIYVMKADGSQVTNLTKGIGRNNDPAWSPSGKRIAFSSDRDGLHQLYLMNPDGSNPIRVTKNITNEMYPSWSPNGAKIAFVSRRDNGYGLYVVNTNGSNEVLLISSGSTSRDISYPEWSPDGTKIAFNYDPSAVNPEIFVIKPDGTGLRQLTYAPRQDLHPSWSPSGERIVFRSDRGSYGEIYVMDADGMNQRNITNHPADDSSPAWSPHVITTDVSPQGRTPTLWGRLK